MFLQTDVSLFQSTLSAKKSVEKFKEKGFDKVVLADTNLSAALTFYGACKGAQIMPIIGVQNTFEGVKYLFIAHNQKGYSVLTEAETKGYNESIFSNENITAVALDIVSMNAEIKSVYGALKQEVKLIDQAINHRLKEKTTIIPVSIANAAKEEDYFTIASMKAVENKSSYEEEIAAGNVVISTIQYPEFFQNEVLESILSKCVNDYTFGNPVPPSFKFCDEVGKEYGVENPTNDSLFEHLAKLGLAKRFEGKEIPANYAEQLDFEIKVIQGMKFAGYFLIVWDFINYAKRNDIPVGPGRGSAAGSLVAYSLEITDLDPLPYGLLFERFLNPDRISFPDVDIDFCQERREEVIQYVIDKYGIDNVGQVITFGKLAAKAAVRDAARVMNAPLYLADKLAKMVPEKPGMTLKLAEESIGEELKNIFKEDFIAEKVWSKALKMEGLKKNQGVHAAGLVISNDEIYNRAPVYNVNGVNVCGYEGGYLEDVNLVKYDFLGLKTLTVIDKTKKSILKQTGKIIDFTKENINDPAVYKYISTGNTSGLFQIESPGMQDLAKRLQPSNFEEVTAMLALYRPGPMEAGMLESFINRKHGREEVSYFFDSMTEALKPILEPTYGLIVYQEQVMQIVRAIAGFSLGEADLVRRAMGKKKIEEMTKISKDFVARAVTKGYKENEAAELFNLIEKFAGYGFNKSHSAAYALVTFYTGFLKYYYPVHFMANLINSDITNTDKLVAYVAECKNLGIELTKPDICTSTVEFTPIEQDKKIIFGLKAVKGVGAGAENLINAANEVKSQNGSIYDLFLLTQRDIEKEILGIEKEINKTAKEKESLEKKGLAAVTKVNELNQKQTLKELTAAQLKTLATNNALVTEYQTALIQNKGKLEILNKNLTNLKNEANSTNEKLDKRVVEALAEVGAFDSFNVTRKDLLDNLESFLNYKTIKEVMLTNKDFSIAKKISLEKERVGLIISSVYEDSVKNKIMQYDIPVDMPIGVLIGKEIRNKKAGGQFFDLKILTPEGDVVSASDFNDLGSKFEVGDLISMFIRINGKYINVSKIQKLTDKILESYPKKTIVTKITIFDNITENIKNAARVEVYDLDGTLVAILKKRVA